MIRNTYVLSKKEVMFISKSVYYNLRNLRFILAGVAEVILGIYILIEIFPLWKAVIVYRQLVSSKDMFLLLIFSAAGLICIGFPIWCPILDGLHFYYFKMEKKNFPEIELGEDGVVVKKSVEGIYAELQYEYSSLDGYVEKDHAIYIIITVQKSKEYFVLHDDTYLEGGRAELLELLGRKNIKQLGNLNEKNK